MWPFRNKQEESIQAKVHVVLVNLCMKMGVTPEEFEDFTSSKGIDRASKFLLDVISVQLDKKNNNNK